MANQCFCPAEFALPLNILPDAQMPARSTPCIAGLSAETASSSFNRLPLCSSWLEPVSSGMTTKGSLGSVPTSVRKRFISSIAVASSMSIFPVKVKLPLQVRSSLMSTILKLASSTNPDWRTLDWLKRTNWLFSPPMATFRCSPALRLFNNVSDN